MVRFTQGFGNREFYFHRANFAQWSFYLFLWIFLALPREMRQATFTWGLELEFFRTIKDFFHWLSTVIMLTLVSPYSKHLVSSSNRRSDRWIDHTPVRVSSPDLPCQTNAYDMSRVRNSSCRYNSTVGQHIDCRYIGTEAQNDLEVVPFEISMTISRAFHVH